jgi:hypothetical protein
MSYQKAPYLFHYKTNCYKLIRNADKRLASLGARAGQQSIKVINFYLSEGELWQTLLTLFWNTYHN